MRFLFTTILVLSLNLAALAEPLVIYSTRKEQLLEPLLKAYEAHSGQKIKVIYDSEGPLLEKLKLEGDRSPADLLLVVDAGNLWRAADLGLLSPLQSPILEKNVPPSLRDPNNLWFAVTRRVRGIVYNPSKINPAELSSYEDLASAKWKGKLCLRSSSKVYNQSLVAMMLERLGPVETKKVVRGWVDNLAVQVFSDDTSLIKALQSGPCQLGIVNSYYLGNLLKSEPQFPAKMFWPNQKTSGAHVNISGAGVTKYSKNKAAAQKLIEWMTESSAQKILSDMNMEFPVNSGASLALNDILKNFGTFKGDTLNLSIAGRRQKEAVMLMDSVGYQ